VQYGFVRQKFEKVAQRCNDNPSMPEKVNWKGVQDRYKRLQEWFDKDTSINAKLSGVGGGDLGELNELLSQMREAREDMVKQKEAEKNVVRKTEE